MLSVYETLLSNIKSKLLKSNRTNVELESKLHEFFEINNAEFKKMARMYSNDDKTRKLSLFDRLDYEEKQVENYRKLKYGDNYAAKSCEHAKSDAE